MVFSIVKMVIFRSYGDLPKGIMGIWDIPALNGSFNESLNMLWQYDAEITEEFSNLGLYEILGFIPYILLPV